MESLSPGRKTFSANYKLARDCSNGIFCRLCFRQNHELHRIFPPNDNPNQMLLLKIEYCTGIGLNFATDSNAVICAKCIGRTEKLFRFKQLCAANERWLKMDSVDDHDVSSDFVGIAAMMSSTTVVEDGMKRSDSCGSLLTIGTEQLEEDDPDCGEEQEITKEESIVDETHQVTSTESCTRPRRRATTRPAPETLSSTAFSFISGTKSRSGRRYLVYKGYHYSDYQSKKNVYRCTQRAPVYCRAKVLLRDERVYEINDNSHDHPMPRRSWSSKV
ncbi:conserved hypothetical protein [Culex quinquefasciatus]|uniref:ZAD domain-containing protein n=1 Tax=Culex quinquefasciatus TaxID=7176 RepID=B0X5C0_CULQU|nr:conserved hypothetical protein [Culex quinquefasciatus]|eukprot:XP_001864842.1 conserved hypothetical protein [Culex quinquefasciatus]